MAIKKKKILKKKSSAKKAPTKKKSSSKKKAPTKKSSSKKSSSKKAPTKKSSSKKKVPANKKAPANKNGTAKPIGSPRSRRRVREITARALGFCKGVHPTAAAPMLGVSVDDMRNMRQGNKFSVPMLCKAVAAGFDIDSIINGPKLFKTRGRRQVSGAQQDLVDKRIRDIAWSLPGKVIAKATGLSVTGAYGIRYAKEAHVTLYTILGFDDAGYSLRHMILGKGDLLKSQA